MGVGPEASTAPACPPTQVSGDSQRTGGRAWEYEGMVETERGADKERGGQILGGSQTQKGC